MTKHSYFAIAGARGESSNASAGIAPLTSYPRAPSIRARHRLHIHPLPLSLFQPSLSPPYAHRHLCAPQPCAEPQPCLPEPRPLGLRPAAQQPRPPRRAAAPSAPPRSSPVRPAAQQPRPHPRAAAASRRLCCGVALRPRLVASAQARIRHGILAPPRAPCVTGSPRGCASATATQHT